MTLTLTLTDQIPSGKNATREGHRKTGGMYRYPNKRFVVWRDAASKEIMMQKAKWPVQYRMRLPLLTPVTVIISYREVKAVPAGGTRDLPGMQDALWHLLVYAGILENDGQIKGATWEYPWRTDGPCVRLTLEV